MQRMGGGWVGLVLWGLRRQPRSARVGLSRPFGLAAAAPWCRCRRLSCTAPPPVQCATAKSHRLLPHWARRRRLPLRGRAAAADGGLLRPPRTVRHGRRCSAASPMRRRCARAPPFAPCGGCAAALPLRVRAVPRALLAVGRRPPVEGVLGAAESGRGVLRNSQAQ